MKNLFKILTISFLLTACGEFEPVVYDTVNGQLLASFAATTSDLAVVIDDEGSVDVQINVTTASSEDRTIGVSVDASSTAAAENYVVPSTVTIPANQYTGTLTIQGIDNSVETTAETIVLMLDPVEGAVVSTSPHVINIYQICPVPSDYFVGDYLIEQTTPYIDGPTLSDGSVVTVSANGTRRTFQSENYPQYCGGTFRTFTINLVCNEIIVPPNGTSCACSQFDEWYAPAINPETYDLADDTVIFVTFTDDVLGDCGTPAQTTYRFTKQ